MGWKVSEYVMNKYTFNIKCYLQTLYYIGINDSNIVILILKAAKINQELRLQKFDISKTLYPL